MVCVGAVEERFELLNESFDGVTPGSGMAEVCQK